MWDTLNQLFEAKNENQKMALKDKLHNVNMTKDESVTSYTIHVAQVKDELEAIGETIIVGEDSPEGLHQEMGGLCQMYCW